MTESNKGRDIRANQPKQAYGEPMSGSKKVKNKNHSRQKNHASHDM